MTGAHRLVPAGSIDALAVRRRLGRRDWAPPQPYGPDGWSLLRRGGDGSVLVSAAVMGDGHEWVHASMTRAARVPSYEDLVALHAAVFADGWAYQVFAPPARHVNRHAFALHLWGRLDGAPVLPEFALDGCI